MKKPEYQSGKEARERFEEGMKELFRVPKSAVVEKPKPKKAPAQKEGNEK